MSHCENKGKRTKKSSNNQQTDRKRGMRATREKRPTKQKMKSKRTKTATKTNKLRTQNIHTYIDNQIASSNLKSRSNERPQRRQRVQSQHQKHENVHSNGNNNNAISFMFYYLKRMHCAHSAHNFVSCVCFVLVVRARSLILWCTHVYRMKLVRQFFPCNYIDCN